MRLLIFTQKMDSRDPVLGFFFSWVRELSLRAESVIVVTLQSSHEEVPDNVTVFSLGKEKKPASRLVYLFRLFQHLFTIRGRYDRVFVHMNQEYILAAGWYWRLQRIPVYFWRNHPHGDIGTRIAAALSSRVFCTSPDSFTARYAKTVLMPVGVDTTLFSPAAGVVRVAHSVCMVGRIDPVKDIELGLAAIEHLHTSGGQIYCAIIGSPSPGREAYEEELRHYVAEHGLSHMVSFSPAVPQSSLPRIYSEYEICLNLTESGSFDKTIVEAAACGAIPVVANASLASFLPPLCVVPRSAEGVALALSRLSDSSARKEIESALKTFIEWHSLSSLMEKLSREMELHV